MITGPIRQMVQLIILSKNQVHPQWRGNNYWHNLKYITLGRPKNLYVWTLIFVSLSLGALGLFDDVLKIKYKNSRGLKSKYKLTGQLIIGCLTLYILIKYSNHEYLFDLYFPFFKNLIIQMGLFFIPFGLFVIIGASNAVNLTDGLDGLATVPVMLVALSFTLISYVVGNTIFSEYLQIRVYTRCWRAFNFLWISSWRLFRISLVQCSSCKIFMGDTGSLSLGGSLAAIAIIVKHEIVLAIIGGLFVLETVSVIIQVISFKLTGKEYLKWPYIIILRKRLG